MYRLEFLLNFLPRTTNSNTGHWTTRNKRARAIKSSVIRKAIVLGRPAEPLKKAHLSLYRYSSVECDFDGLVSSFKHIIDGLVQAEVIVDDKASVIGRPHYEWVKTSPGKGMVRVVVEET